MPNLLPDWLPWIHPAGRLIWATIITFVGLAFVIALIKPPKLQRPFPTRVGVALYFMIPIVGYIIAILIPDDANLENWKLDAIIVDIVLLLLVAHTMLMVLSRKPRDPGQETTWTECYLGALGVFALMVARLRDLPREWLTFANAYLAVGRLDQVHLPQHRGHAVDPAVALALRLRLPGAARHRRHRDLRRAPRR